MDRERGEVEGERGGVQERGKVRGREGRGGGREGKVGGREGRGRGRGEAWRERQSKPTSAIQLTFTLICLVVFLSLKVAVLDLSVSKSTVIPNGMAISSVLA